MVRPKPCVLFAQSFLHPRLAEYVDEVRFTEPVIICACEFLELGTSSLCPTLSLSGVSFPQSFALEIFIRIGGEARFKRLSPAFLYSPSASGVLDVQAAVTDHLVIRGSYRSLSLIIYGNSAKELGQFNVDHDIDSTLSGLTLPAETVFKPEDLPEALQEDETGSSKKKKVCLLRSLQLVYRDPEQSVAVHHLLSSAVAIIRCSSHSAVIRRIFDILLFVASTVLSAEHGIEGSRSSHSKMPTRSHIKIRNSLKQARDQIQGIEAKIQSEGMLTHEALAFGLVVETICGWIQTSFGLTSTGAASDLSAEEFLIGGLAAVQLLCTDARWCYDFVVAGGMHLLVRVLQYASAESSATALLVLRAIQCACQHAFACEALLGWWPAPGLSTEKKKCVSVGYCSVMKIMVQTKRINVLQLASQVIEHLRAYELASEFQCEAESLLDDSVPPDKMGNMEVSEGTIKNLTLSIKNLMNMLHVRDFPQEWCPAEMTHWLLLDGDDNAVSLSPSAIFNWIAASKYSFAVKDLNAHILTVLQERRFISSLSTLLSAPWMRSASGKFQNSLLDLLGNVETLILALISSRSGLLFLASDQEATASLIATLKGIEKAQGSDFMGPRHACSLMAAGFICKTRDIGQLLETSLSVVAAMDRLLATPRQSESFLWLLWELSVFSRSEAGKQALSCISYFPEVFILIIEALQPDSHSLSIDTKERALKRAILHSAAEVMQVVLTDPVTTSLTAWIPHAVSLQKALQYCSPTTIDLAVGNHSLGSSSKDALCARLLDWVDAAVLFHRKGPVGLLRYAAALVVGSVTSVAVGGLPSNDAVEPEAIGESAASTELPTVSTLLGRGVTLGASGTLLPDTAVIQLTVSMRIMASLSCHPGVAAVLYGEGAMSILYILLEYGAGVLQSSTTDYDYIVEEDGEADGITEMVLEQEREQSLLGLLLPSLLLLLSLLRRLQSTGEEYRNTRLVETLLQLHRCVCARMASKVTVPAETGGMLLLASASRVLASILSCWPVYGWTPSFFPKLLGLTASSAQAANVFPMEPKEALSVLWLLGDMLPEENSQFYKDKIFAMDILRSLAVSTLLGVNSMQLVGWHCDASNCEKLIEAMNPQLDHIASMVLHLASSTSMLLRGLLIKFLVRMACQSEDNTGALLHPMLTFVNENTCTGIVNVDNEAFRSERFLEILKELARHPSTKRVLLQKGLVRALVQSINGKGGAFNLEAVILDSPLKKRCSLLIIKILVTICDPEITMSPRASIVRRCVEDCPGFKDYCAIVALLHNYLLCMPLSKDLEVVADCLCKLVNNQLGRAAYACVALSTRSKSGETFLPLANLTSAEPVDDLAPQIDGAVPEGASSFLPLCKRFAVSLSDSADPQMALDVLYSFALAAIQLAAAGRSACGLGALQLLFEMEKMESKETLGSLVHLLKVKTHEGDEESQDTKSLSCLKALKCVTALVHLLENLPAIMFLEKKVKLVLDGLSAKQACKDDDHERMGVNWKALPALLHEGNEVKSTLDIPDDEIDAVTDEESWQDKFTWECTEDSSEKLLGGAAVGKRKSTGVAEGGSKKHRVDAGASGPTLDLPSSGNGAGRTTGMLTSTSGSNRRDTFRQRKPNTSRPPSMHVDDYVARERGNEVTTSGTGQRGALSGGRPPSIHVDEFMARQREKHQVIGSPVNIQSQTSAAPVAQAPVQQVKVEIMTKQFARVKPILPEDDLQDVDIEIEGVPDTDDLLSLPVVDEVVGEENKQTLTAEVHLLASTANAKLPSADGNIPEAARLASATTTVQQVGLTNPPYIQGDGNEPGFMRTGSLDSIQSASQTSNVQSLQRGKESILTLGMAVQMQEPTRASMDIYASQSVPEHRTAAAPLDSVNVNMTLHRGTHVQFPTVQPVPPPLPPPPPIPAGVIPEKYELSSHKDQHPFASSASMPLLSFDAPNKTNITGSNLPPLIPDYQRAMSEALSNSGRSTTAVPPVPPPPLPSAPGPWQAAAPGTPMNSVTTFGSSAAPAGHFNIPIMGAGTMVSHPWPGTPLGAEDAGSSGTARPPPPPPPLPPTPPPFSSPQMPVLQAPSMPHLPPPYGQNVGRLPAAEGRPIFTYPSGVDATSVDQRFPQFSQQPMIGQPPVPHSPVLPSNFQPPLPPGRPNLAQNLVASVAGSQQQHQFQGLQPGPTSQQPEPGVSAAQLPPFQQQLLQVPVQQHQPQTLQQQQESGKLLQQILASPDAIENLLKDQNKLQSLLEQHPKLISLLQEKMGQG